MAQTTTELPIAGMTCVGCARSIESALKSNGGVSEAVVDFPGSSVRVSFDSDAIDLASVSDLIRSAGFSVVEVAEGESLETARKKSDEAELDRLRSRLVVGGILTVPLFLISMGRDFGLLGQWAHASWVNWLMFGLATPVQFYVGLEYYINASNSLKNRSANMDVLVSLGSTTAYLYSCIVTVYLTFGSTTWGQHVYFETSATIITLILLGRLVESKAKGKTNAAIDRLLNLQAKTARVERNGQQIELPIQNIRAQDVLVVKPGERIPLDGVVVEGNSAVDESMLTGESMPVDKSAGMEVTGATINREGLLRVKVTRLGDETALSKIIQQVKTAQASKAPIQQLADSITNVFVPIVLAVALATFLVWYFVVGDSTQAVLRMISVLIISCPCAMGLATPLAVMVGMGRGAEKGILFKSSQSLQRASQITYVVLDKTGTLTDGKVSVIDVVTAADFSKDQVLRIAATAETASEHPIASAIVDAAKQRSLSLGKLTNFFAIVGQGLVAEVDGTPVRIGNQRSMENANFDISPFLPACDRLQSEAKTVIWVASGGRVIGLIGVADTLKPTSEEAVRQLRAAKLDVAMVSGDNQQVADAVARKVGITEVMAETLPRDKAKRIDELKRKGHVVAMVGDGINDAPALASADVGIAIGTGTDIAIESAGVTLMRPDLAGVAEAIRLSSATMRNIKQNLFWAFAYNVALIPIAAGVLAGVAWAPSILRELHPILAAVAMVLSDLVIVGNALRLRNFGKI